MNQTIDCLRTVRDAKEFVLREALIRHGMNVRAAADDIGVSAKTAYAWVESFGLRTWMNKMADDPQIVDAVPDVHRVIQADQVLFLDIDGVLNDHTKLENGYCGTKPACVSKFNQLLTALPNLKLVISSAWRYMCLRNDASLRGFELLLLTHGVACDGRVIGVTDPDGRVEDEPNHHDKDAWHIAGLKWRARQIRAWVARNDVGTWAAVDDLDLGLPNFVRTKGSVGLTFEDVNQLIAIFTASGRGAA